MPERHRLGLERSLLRIRRLIEVDAELRHPREHPHSFPPGWVAQTTRRRFRPARASPSCTPIASVPRTIAPPKPVTSSTPPAICSSLRSEQDLARARPVDEPHAELRSAHLGVLHHQVTLEGCDELVHGRALYDDEGAVGAHDDDDVRDDLPLLRERQALDGVPLLASEQIARQKRVEPRDPVGSRSPPARSVRAPPPPALTSSPTRPGPASIRSSWSPVRELSYALPCRTVAFHML